MKTVFSVLAILFSVFSYGQNEKPNEERAKEDISSVITKESENNIVLVSFKKTDGLDSQKDGVLYYTMEIEGEIKYLKNGYFENTPYMGGRSKGFLRIQNPVDNFIPSNIFKLVNNEDVGNIIGVIKYVKKESGWKISSLLLGLKQD